MAHLKRYEMPASWPVPVKSRFWVTRPSAGPHPLKRCLPLQLIVRDLLGLAATAAEVRTILRAGNVLVDGKPRDAHFPVGLMDSIAIPDIGRAYRMVPTKKGLRLAEIALAAAGSKLCQVRGITTVKGGLQQLRLHDGRTLFAGKKAAEELDAGASALPPAGGMLSGLRQVRIGDALQLSVPAQKVTKHLALEAGCHALITAGRSAGTTGTVTEIRRRKLLGEQSVAVLETSAGRTETTLAYVFPVPAGFAEALTQARTPAGIGRQAGGSASKRAAHPEAAL